MSQQSSGPEQPELVDEPAPEATTEAEPAAEAEPLNRAARRAKPKQADPSHVGPQPGFAPARRGGRSHTKRRIS
ncbi:hypothetical protein [Pseudonocardia alaniniphila]|uniref:23S rRNA pseudouridylate synthase B n=1 Tax=Pseudonocardia alaniniphila TaxID=75291 RepID=A0ABS9TSR2_9PSEU|nr:hypothetical protein [Pseudonocardia alaniniphila]MCH6171584.1 hypothetical protein [Pseudonocardia alaniniphila]